MTSPQRFRTLHPASGSAGEDALTAMLFGLLAFGAACSKPAPAPQAPQVTVAPAVTRQVTEWDEYTGHFEAPDAVEVRPRVSGFVQKVAFAEGAIVNKGDVLFVIDPRPYASQVAILEAELERARSRTRLAAAELERAQRLVSTQAISGEEFDARKSGVDEGDAAVRAADAALLNARLNLEWTTVRAPISGRVGRADVTSGNLVQAGPPSATLLTTIVSVDPMYVYFDSDEQSYLKYMHAARGTAGRPAGRRPVQIGLTSEAGFPHEGTLDFIDNRVDPSAGTIRVRAVVANKDRVFTPGLFARVRLTGTERREATLVQDQAIGTDQDRKFVLVLKPDSSIEYRAITLGRTLDGWRVVQSGLAAGEHVVVNGLQRVRPGMKVLATRAGMAPDSNKTLARAP